MVKAKEMVGDREACSSGLWLGKLAARARNGIDLIGMCEDVSEQIGSE